LHWEGWRVNHKRVERIWREEGLKVPQKQPKRRRLWLNDGSCIRLRPTHWNHVLSYDFVMDRTSDGRPIRMLTIVDETTRECLAIDVAKKLTSEDVLERLSDLFVRRGVPEHIRSDNGSEFTAKCVREWLGRVGVKTLYIEPGSPWENGYVESFNGKLRDEFLKRESFDTVLEAKVLIERWRQAYNTVRPHSALGYRPPAPEARQPCAAASATPQRPHRAGLSEGEFLKKTGISLGGRSATIRPDDVPASLYRCLGIDPRKEYRTATGRPVMIVRDGRPIEGLFV
jgi:transposase InsO family protein